MANAENSEYTRLRLEAAVRYIIHFITFEASVLHTEIAWHSGSVR